MQLPSPELQLQWRIEELEDWLRWYGCEFVDNEEFHLICNGYIVEGGIYDYISLENIRYQADAFRELGWCFYMLKLFQEEVEDKNIGLSDCVPDKLIDSGQIFMVDFMGQIKPLELSAA